MLGHYQQLLANEHLKNANLTVDLDIARQQNANYQEQLRQYNDVDVKQEDGDADSPAKPVGPKPGDEVKYEDVEKVAAKHTA
ncbi:hypothetical protein SEA_BEATUSCOMEDENTI_37 [Arthrobacter phage BeatusComedenti]|uniref:Uncharacterized protein n=1 Tax=Arthrobacter phage BeatusComedenti TaxID=2656523 RepID=A0A649VVE8_9CAUD|nr:hypothetical protein SEA_BEATUSCOMEDENTI_37 [Arthrobacter phage BeatusComedenti]